MIEMKVYKGKDGKYYFTIEDSKGNVLLRNQGYTRKVSAEKGLDSVKRNIRQEGSIKRSQSSSGKYYFNVVARNGEIVATSPQFYSKTRREGVIIAFSL